MTIAIFDKDKKNSVRQSNFLIEARYKLTRQEMRIVNTLKAMVSEANEYIINLKDIANIIESKSDSLIPDLKKAADGLLKKPIKIYQGNTVTQMNWISSFTLTKGDTFATFAVDPRIKPYLFSIKSNYTDFELTELLSFKSFYSFRIYELAKQYYPNIPKRTFNLEELKEKFCCESSYNLYSNFRDKVLVPAIMEINNNSKLALSLGFEPEKTGKKITGVKFSFYEKTINSEKVIVEEDSNKIEDRTKQDNKKIVKNSSKTNEKKPLKRGFAAPTDEEILQYCIEKNYHIDYKKINEYYTDEDSKIWIDSNEKPVKNWKKKVQAWASNTKNYKSLPKEEKESLNIQIQKEEEPKEISSLREAFKRELANIGKASAWMHFGDIIKTENGFKINALNSKAANYKDILEKLNIELQLNN